MKKNTILTLLILMMINVSYSQQLEGISEKDFTMKLDNILTKKINFCKIEKKVGLPAKKSTCNKYDVIKYTQNDIDLDINLDHGITWAQVIKSDNISYWTFENDNGVIIVGVCTLQNGKIIRFRGDIIPLRE